MRVLILGVAGMLGHKLYQQFSSHYELYATVRSHPANYQHFGLFDKDHIIGGVDADNFDTVIQAMAQIKPDVVINCIGIIKQLHTAKNPIISIKINALFPHQLAQLCQASGARLFHISTDCVFNGRGSMYTEDTPANAEDLYGRTKHLGEVDTPGAITLRTSIIGRELATKSGLVEWFLSNRQQGGTVRGFNHAIYTGFTTLEMAKIIRMLIDDFPELSGLYQVSSDPINKYELLKLVNTAFDANLQIEADDSVNIDRSLDSSRFRQVTGYTPPNWQTMIAEMANDDTPYDNWKTDK